MKKIYYYSSKVTNASQNLALEEFVFQSRREGSIFIIWQNAPSVIIGRNQVAASEVDLAYARRRGIPVLRRLTGGGAVYHDLGNINFTFIEDYDPENPPRLSSLVSPIADFLRQMNLPAFTGTRNDLIVDRKKVCGTAFAIDKCRRAAKTNRPSPEKPVPLELFISSDSDQVTILEEKPSASLQEFSPEKGAVSASKNCRPRILVHGCILFDVDLDTLSRILTPPPEKLAKHGIPSVRSRVANLRDYLPEETASSFREKLVDSVLSEKLPENLLLSSEDYKSVLALAENYRNLAPSFSP